MKRIVFYTMPIGINRAYCPGGAIADWRGASRVARYLYMRPVAKSAKRAIEDECRAQLGNGVPYSDSVGLRIKFYYRDRRRDIDGGIKMTLDALQGVLYVNDRQVKVLNVQLLHDKSNPRVEAECWRIASNKNSEQIRHILTV